jgi:hypothetical protein
MGGNDSTSSSRPLNAKERAAAYQAGIKNIGDSTGNSGLFSLGNDGNYTLDTSGLAYNAPAYNQLDNGDYASLEKNIVASRTAPLDEAWRKAQETMNQDASDRGLWSSGMPIKNEQDYYAQNFLPAYQQAGADAAIQRYTMQQQDLQGQNAQNMANAQQNYESKYRPLDYLQGLYNGTGGVISSGGSTGWSI